MNPRARLALGLAVATVMMPALGFALDFLSPGKLSQPHAYLEGLDKCTECHEPGNKLSPQRCLACHKEIASRVDARKGFHGKLPDSNCQKCHREHKGRLSTLIDWGGDKRHFDHRKAGWVLEGKHAKAKCEACHETRRIADPAVRALLAERPARPTNLGLPTTCTSCHFNEHREQLGTDCTKCHNHAAFKPSIFDHAKCDFPLQGQHPKVKCEKCHPTVQAPPVATNAFPAPRAPTYVIYKPIKHVSCGDCHKDPHQGRLGLNCVGCHVLTDWKSVKKLDAERRFHEKTRYKLEGAHARAPCEGCHPGNPPKRTGLAFQRCTDCHPDAHLGQHERLAEARAPSWLDEAGFGFGEENAASEPAVLRPRDAGDCDLCHSLETFSPATFTEVEHGKTRFSLTGGHTTVACILCHPQNPDLASQIPADVRDRLAREKRPERFSMMRFEPIGPTNQCETCHKDPHAGQFAEKMASQGCLACHERDHFKKPRFDHDRDSRFKLEGKHAKAACGGCHPREEHDGLSVGRWKPIETTCASCHGDPHLGQFAPADGSPIDCTRCHEKESFKKPHFEHKPPFTEFKLQGKHEKVTCEKCHPAVEVAPGVKAVRYKPLPTQCAGCHSDQHKGAFRGYEP
jgi:hypothetical protein